MKEIQENNKGKGIAFLAGLFLILCAVISFVLSFGILPGIGIILAIIFAVIGVIFLAMTGK